MRVVVGVGVGRERLAEGRGECVMVWIAEAELIRLAVEVDEGEGDGVCSVAVRFEAVGTTVSDPVWEGDLVASLMESVWDGVSGIVGVEIGVGDLGDRVDGRVVVVDGVLVASVREGVGDAVWQPSCVTAPSF